jgi:hypothetical protein
MPATIPKILAIITSGNALAELCANRAAEKPMDKSKAINKA